MRLAAPYRCQPDARPQLVVSSGAGDHWREGDESGRAVASFGHGGCSAVDAAGQCTGGVWPHVAGATWIWRPGRSPGPIAFVKRFVVHKDASGMRGVLSVAADNAYKAYLNGKLVAARGPFVLQPLTDPENWRVVCAGHSHRPTYHRVRRGEWLWQIARAVFTSRDGHRPVNHDVGIVARRIYRLNREKIRPDPGSLRPGLLLLISK